jgi:hypothetical protein
MPRPSRSKRQPCARFAGVLVCAVGAVAGTACGTSAPRGGPEVNAAIGGDAPASGGTATGAAGDLDLPSSARADSTTSGGPAAAGPRA